MPNLPTPCYSGKGAAAVSKAVALRNEQPGRHRQSHETLNHEPPEPAPHHGHRTRRTKQNLAFARHLQNLINTEPKKYHECSAVKEASKPRASRRTSSPLATSTRHPATGRWPEFPCIRKNPNFYYPSWLQSPPCFVSSHACRSTPKPFLRKVGCSLNHENQSYGLMWLCSSALGKSASAACLLAHLTMIMRTSTTKSHFNKKPFDIACLFLVRAGGKFQGVRIHTCKHDHGKTIREHTIKAEARHC